MTENTISRAPSTVTMSVDGNGHVTLDIVMTRPKRRRRTQKSHLSAAWSEVITLTTT